MISLHGAQKPWPDKGILCICTVGPRGLPSRQPGEATLGPTGNQPGPPHCSLLQEDTFPNSQGLIRHTHTASAKATQGLWGGCERGRSDLLWTLLGGFKGKEMITMQEVKGKAPGPLPASTLGDLGWAT